MRVFSSPRAAENIGLCHRQQPHSSPTSTHNEPPNLFRGREGVGGEGGGREGGGPAPSYCTPCSFTLVHSPLLPSLLHSPLPPPLFPFYLFFFMIIIIFLSIFAPLPLPHASPLSSHSPGSSPLGRHSSYFVPPVPAGPGVWAALIAQRRGEQPIHLPAASLPKGARGKRGRRRRRGEEKKKRGAEVLIHNNDH